MNNKKIPWDEILTQLSRHGFDPHLVSDSAQALVLSQKLLAQTDFPFTVGLGGSKTVQQIGLLPYLRIQAEKNKITLFDQYREGLSRAESLAERKKGLTADWLITGTNALTYNGYLVNMDGSGNRVAGLAFGPTYVLVVVGKNKIVADIPAGIERIEKTAAPLNAKRLNRNTPCVETGYCMDCRSADRICNALLVTKRSFPKGRIRVIIVQEELGL